MDVDGIVVGVEERNVDGRMHAIVRNGMWTVVV